MHDQVIEVDDEEDGFLRCVIVFLDFWCGGVSLVSFCVSGWYSLFCGWCGIVCLFVICGYKGCNFYLFLCVCFRLLCVMLLDGFLRCVIVLLVRRKRCCKWWRIWVRSWSGFGFIVLFCSVIWVLIRLWVRFWWIFWWIILMILRSARCFIIVWCFIMIKVCLVRC